jgi:hypothetical protein
MCGFTDTTFLTLYSGRACPAFPDDAPRDSTELVEVKRGR